jgi:hypothetical protein
MSVPRLGPILMPTSPKRRKQEKVNREFTDEILDELDIHSSRTVVPDCVYRNPYCKLNR